MNNLLKLPLMLIGILLFSCGEDSETPINEIEEEVEETELTLTGLNIDLTSLFDYESQSVPNYITKDNTQDNYITNEGAVLGRVLFYDVNLSADNSIACASCHKQEFAFGDNQTVSDGVAGSTGRHSMRLVNARFGEEMKFFWDKRASTLEEQVTMPIQDHIEMGFSGEDGDPSIDDLITKLEGIDNYKILFQNAFGTEEITEELMQNALAQFVRSIQSFDSKYDEGRAQVNNDQDDFPNFTAQENLGKRLFIMPPPDGGVGCGGCHRAPEFDIDPNSMNNGITGVAGTAESTDLTNERSPSLRDLVNHNGELNGPFMHDGSLATLEDVLAHYSNIDPMGNSNLDRKLAGPNGQGQQLNLNDEEIEAIISFLKTLSGEELYVAEQWADPFE